MGPTHACTPPPPSTSATAHQSNITRACTACPSTLLFVAYARGPHLPKPPQPPRTQARTRAQDLVSMYEIIQRTLVFKLVSPNFEERGDTKPAIP
jgi:hypothetical protein